MRLRALLSEYFTFFTLHFLYFVLLGLLGAVLIFVIEDGSVSFLDSLFMAYSSCSLTGLSTSDISVWSANSQIVVLFLMGLGSQVLMSAVPIIVRQHYYRIKVKESVVHGIPLLYEHRWQTEYQALRVMKWLILGWYFGITLFSHLLLSTYLWTVRRDVLNAHNLNPGWFALFHSVSAFCNCGLGLLSSSMVEFQSDYFILIWTSLLILFGNTCYPVALRFMVWVLHHLSPRNAAFKYLLDHPRRCCTHLFGRFHTRILIAFNVAFTIVQYACFMGLEFNRSSLDVVPGHLRSLISWFQTISTRTSGFNALDMAALSPAMVLVLCIFMFISSYPIIAGIRRVSEHKVGDSVPDDDEHSLAIQKEGDVSLLGQVKSNCTDDLPLLVLAVFIIAVVEGDLIEQSDSATLFDIIFEVSSAYGTVGLSLGFPGAVTSLSGAFHPISKVVMILIMLGGRHRGLPRSIDGAVNLQQLLSAWPEDLQRHWPSSERDPADAPVPSTVVNPIPSGGQLQPVTVVNDPHCNGSEE
eukprot:GGOE01018427.1.p1 GENE.GGOE01018427.1~~GGOE01018427.1.p1  ORF type:complete len:525 (-),score=172.57 GGOE01018427.1:218-1792(-)